MVTITCYGGVGEIGGNKILVSDRDTKVFLDFGAGFSDGSPFFSAGIEPRKVNGAGDFLEFGLLPRLSGLYSESALHNTELKYVPPELDAVVLSHYHSDHMGRIDLLDPDIPVYCGETTGHLHAAASECGSSPLDDHELRTFRTGGRFTVGSIEFEPVHIDHSIPGAYGFILHTSEGAVAYTGDFRFHGPKGSMTADFVTRAAEAGPLALITEGTRVTGAGSTPKREFSEAQVEEEATRIVKGRTGLVFSSFRGNDVDRIMSLHRACVKSGRRLVVSMKVAALIDELRKDSQLDLPRVGKDILVYIRRKKKGRYEDGEYYGWERRFLDGGINSEQVRREQGELFLHLDQWSFPELIDIRPDRGGAYIRASTEAFNEEGELSEEVTKNWVDHFGFSYHQIHASGHAPMEKVESLVRAVGGRKVIPVHTERPDLFPEMAKDSRVVSPKKGKPITLR